MEVFTGTYLKGKVAEQGITVMLGCGNSHHLRGVCHHGNCAWWSNPRAARAWAPSLQRQAGPQCLLRVFALLFIHSPIMFLDILNSPYQDSDIGNNFANKLILALGSLHLDHGHVPLLL
eukprot:TRINITY_DN9527_c0_g1_i2.p1 TRINITY_DN9527_c0_g1~~TRINITY_DN9527_c0_g1_i2.p1  ORF type:complete len:119 (-),score=18.91 TRINITY_DN9527_c0_g1_i2:259-615(-)